MQKIKNITCLTTLFLVGCATAPLVVSENHPANAAAAIGKQSFAKPLLEPDADTLRTQALLEQRAKEAARAENQPPDGPATPNTPAPMQHMDGMKMDGMKMNHGSMP